MYIKCTVRQNKESKLLKFSAHFLKRDLHEANVIKNFLKLINLLASENIKTFAESSLAVSALDKMEQV